jgi:hypothetical protein
MCHLVILPAELCKHPKCIGCEKLLEPEFNDLTLCRCGKYHNAPAVADSRFCRSCLGEEVPAGTPQGEPARLTDEDDDFSSLIEL